jgi:hypothetical protein
MRGLFTERARSLARSRKEKNEASFTLDKERRRKKSFPAAIAAAMRLLSFLAACLFFAAATGAHRQRPRGYVYLFAALFLLKN